MAARTLLNWAVREEYIEANPLAGMRWYKPPKARERVLRDDELREVLAKAEQAPYPFGNIVMLLALTGLRRGDAAALQWDWIDSKEKLITLPAELTKNSRTHTLPYGAFVADALSSVPELGE